jgi:hypothetical protein
LDQVEGFYAATKHQLLSQSGVILHQKAQFAKYLLGSKITSIIVNANRLHFLGGDYTTSELGTTDFASSTDTQKYFPHIVDQYKIFETTPIILALPGGPVEH